MANWRIGLKGRPFAPLMREAVEPIEMIQVAGENAENFQLEPSHLLGRWRLADGQENAGREAVDSVLAERDVV